jgi:hypothetical protein
MPNEDEGQEGQELEGQEGQEGQHEEKPAWTPPASQEEFDRILTKRLKQLERQRYGDYQTLKSKAEQYDTLSATTKTEHDKAVEEAELQGYSAALQTTVPRLVRAEFRAAAKGLLTDEQVDALIEDVDLLRYVDEDGEPDEEKIQRKIKAFAPKQGNPSFGQGQRGTPPKTSNMNDVIRSMAGVRK